MHPDELTWITDKVAITNFVSAQNKKTLAEHEVKAILCLDRELMGDAPSERGIESIQLLHLNDGANALADFAEAVALLERLVTDYDRVVVHCRAGRSRSVAVVAAYLTKSQGMCSRAALEFVRAKRDSAVALELISSVEKLENS